MSNVFLTILLHHSFSVMSKTFGSLCSHGPHCSEAMGTLADALAELPSQPVLFTYRKLERLTGQLGASL